MSDRTVHASLADGSHIVRYDRAGKWYHEDIPDSGRRPLTLDEAVELACADGAHRYLWRPGGAAFDARCRRARGGSA